MFASLKIFPPKRKTLFSKYLVTQNENVMILNVVKVVPTEAYLGCYNQFWRIILGE
jgi:hypothetical protein